MENSTLTESTVAVSDFSRENAEIIFKDVHDNGHEYLVLNNKQPTAVVLSIDTFLQQQKNSNAGKPDAQSGKRPSAGARKKSGKQ